MAADEDDRMAEALAALETLATSPYDKAVHLKAISLCRAEPDLLDMAAQARETMAERFELDDATWTEWIADVTNSSDQRTVDGVQHVLAIYHRALHDNLSAWTVTYCR